MIYDSNIIKKIPKVNDIIIRLGGPAYRIGLGGGYGSSVNNNGSKNEKDAVQRGDPQMGNKLNRVIKTLSELEPNPIITIHDQGAGGLANVVKEIVYPLGGNVDLTNVTLGDTKMTPLEIWCSEFQESNVIVIDPESLDIIKLYSDLENINCDILGNILESGCITVKYNGQTIVDLPLEPILEPSIRKEYDFSYDLEINHSDLPNESLDINKLDYYVDDIDNQLIKNNNDLSFKIDYISKIYNYSFIDYISKVLNHLDVSSKRFLTTKVDRSVTGLIAQQQCVGPFMIPLSNYNLAAFSHFDTKGIASSIGEKPRLGIYSCQLQAQYSICEMLSNMMGVYIGDIENIKCSVNWMWPNNHKNESYKLYKTAIYLTNDLKELGIGIDGGKDSLSMVVDTGKSKIVSPGNVVISGYAACPNIYKKVTPDFKKLYSSILWISFNNTQTDKDISNYSYRLNGSIYESILDPDRKTNSNFRNPSILNMLYVKKIFNYIQSLISKNKIESLHDLSDGGLITTLFEMCYSGYKGADISLNCDSPHSFYNILFSEEPGVIIEISDNIDRIKQELKDLNISYLDIGKTNNTSEIKVDVEFKNSNKIDFVLDIKQLSNIYEEKANIIENKQCNIKCVASEQNNINQRYLMREEFKYNIDFLLNPNMYNLNHEVYSFCINFDNNAITKNVNKYQKNVLILRDEGSNGDAEMCAIFKYLNYNVYNYNTLMLVNNIDILDKVDGIVFVGGFTYSDLMGAATCWANKIKLSDNLFYRLNVFFQDTSKFIIGVCNGFQLLIKLGLFGDNIKLEENTSGRFESRFSTIKVVDDNNSFTKNMLNITFGMWVAHKCGRIEIKSDKLETNPGTDLGFRAVLKYDTSLSCDAIHNTKDISNYPLNPNGSYDDIAGITNNDGRILGLMPHFERSFTKYQLPYIPEKYKNIKVSPWLYIIKNLTQLF